MKVFLQAWRGATPLLARGAYITNSSSSTLQQRNSLRCNGHSPRPPRALTAATGTITATTTSGPRKPLMGLERRKTTAGHQGTVAALARKWVEPPEVVRGCWLVPNPPTQPPLLPPHRRSVELGLPVTTTRKGRATCPSQEKALGRASESCVSLSADLR